MTRDILRAYAHLNNEDWQDENRDTGKMVGQGNWEDNYRCRRSGSRWLLVAL